MNISADFSNFYLVFGVSVKFQVRLTPLLFRLFANFELKNPYEIIAIQTPPFACTQTGIQTLSTKKSERNSKYECLFHKVEVGSYSRLMCSLRWPSHHCWPGRSVAFPCYCLCHTPLTFWAKLRVLKRQIPNYINMCLFAFLSLTPLFSLEYF